MNNPALWKGLRGRYEDSSRPHKFLAIDGGGIRGMIALGVLEAMETLLAKHLGRGTAFRLCECFDYMAGTSTGAIIATALASGMSVADIITLYRQAGASMFEKACLLEMPT